jgi:hypothetical protein
MIAPPSNFTVRPFILWERGKALLLQMFRDFDAERHRADVRGRYTPTLERIFLPPPPPPPSASSASSKSKPESKLSTAASSTGSSGGDGGSGQRRLLSVSVSVNDEKKEGRGEKGMATTTKTAGKPTAAGSLLITDWNKLKKRWIKSHFFNAHWRYNFVIISTCFRNLTLLFFFDFLLFYRVSVTSENPKKKRRIFYKCTKI